MTARHVASQGRGGGFTLEHLAEFLGSQILLLTPVVAGILGWGLWVGVREGFVRRREPYRFLLAFAAPVLGTYLAVGLQGKVQANWAAAAYPPLALAAAGLLLERRAGLAAAPRRAQTRLLIAAGAVALTFCAVGHVIGRLDLPRRLDPTARLRGWAELGRAVGITRGADAGSAAHLSRLRAATRSPASSPSTCRDGLPRIISTWAAG